MMTNLRFLILESKGPFQFMDMLSFLLAVERQ